MADPFLLAVLMAGASIADDRLTVCVDIAATDPVTAVATASEWLREGDRAGRGHALECLGLAHAQTERWEPARSAFLTAAEARKGEPAVAARLLTLAGNAALADGDTLAALGDFDRAVASGGAEGAALGRLQADRARALVALGNLDPARAALDRAVALAPDDAANWLLSAALARRQGDLARAAADIALAASRAPQEPEIGLEAGVIAALAGQPEVARRSFESALALAPDGPVAEQARDYIAQLDLAAGPQAPARPEPAQPR